MAQLDNMLKLLKQIDSVEIPPNDFETAWQHKVDVIRNQQTHPTRAAIVVPSKQQEAVRGNLKTDATALEISLTSTEEKSAAEQAEEAARKAALEKQNALPVWHTHSTVSTTAGNVNYIKSETDAGIKSEIKEEEDRKPKIEDLDDKVAAYYAEMEREKALQAQRDASSADEDDSDDEFDDEFEDVGGVSASDTASPAVMGGPTSAPTSAPVGIKREFDTDSGTSAPQTAVGTPNTPADEGPVAKKIKMEPDVKKEESDEDDEEFEDV
jgi:transcription initiation factor TFIIE subunit alpha